VPFRVKIRLGKTRVVIEIRGPRNGRQTRLRAAIQTLVKKHNASIEPKTSTRSRARRRTRRR
jgi:hypothetical protein